MKNQGMHKEQLYYSIRFPENINIDRGNTTLDQTQIQYPQGTQGNGQYVSL